MRYEDLPPALQRQVDAQVGGPKKKRTTKKEAGVDGPGHCGCGEPMPSYREWEKNHQGPGHRRFALSISGS